MKLHDRKIVKPSFRVRQMPVPHNCLNTMCVIIKHDIQDISLMNPQAMRTGNSPIFQIPSLQKAIHHAKNGHIPVIWQISFHKKAYVRPALRNPCSSAFSTGSR